MADGYREALLARVREAFDGRSDRELAKAAGVSVETVRRYRVGECVPGAEFLQALCTNLDVSAAWLLGGEGPLCKHELSADRLRGAVNATLMRVLAERLGEGPQAVIELMRQLAEGGTPGRALPVENGAAVKDGAVDGDGEGRGAAGDACPEIRTMKPLDQRASGAEVVE